MKKKGLITAYSLLCVIVAGLVATIIVLASGNRTLRSSISILYVASDIGGTVSATYQVGGGGRDKEHDRCRWPHNHCICA